MLSNLKESGSIEQDADLALLMYRHDYYTGQGVPSKASKFENNSEYAKKINEQIEAANKKDKNSNISNVTINIAKNRNGQTGKLTLLFTKNFSLFDNPSLDFERDQAREDGDYDPDDE